MLKHELIFLVIIKLAIDYSVRSIKQYFLPHSYVFAVMGEDGMSLRNDMWHGLRNELIMWNVIYAE